MCEYCMITWYVWTAVWVVASCCLFFSLSSFLITVSSQAYILLVFTSNALRWRIYLDHFAARPRLTKGDDVTGWLSVTSRMPSNVIGFVALTSSTQTANRRSVWFLSCYLASVGRGRGRGHVVSCHVTQCQGKVTFRFWRHKRISLTMTQDCLSRHKQARSQLKGPWNRLSFVCFLAQFEGI